MDFTDSEFKVDPLEDALKIHNEISSKFKKCAIWIYGWGWLGLACIQVFMYVRLGPSLELFQLILAVNVFFILIPLISIGLLSITAALHAWKR